MGNTVSAPPRSVSSSCSSSSSRLADPGKELLRCAEQGDTGLVAWILACDAHYLAHSSVFGGNTAWHKAAKTGRLEVFEAMERVVTQQFQSCKGDGRYGLIRLGPNPAEVIKRLINKSNLKGITPLMLACAGCHTETVAWLLKHGADVWRHDRVRRHTALHCAAQAGSTDAIRMLLAAAGPGLHANEKRLVELGNHAGLTALHYAVFCDQIEVMQQLLAADADITVQAEFPDLDWGSVNAGDTAMHIAANKGNIDSIQILLRAYNEKSGALMPESGMPRRVRDPRAMRNDYGRLPYHLAMRKGFTWLAEMLDPSVPVRYILAGEQLGTDTTWGPPRLATIAAKVLHQSLVSDLKAIKQAQTQQTAAADVTDAATTCSRPGMAVECEEGAPAAQTPCAPVAGPGPAPLSDACDDALSSSAQDELDAAAAAAAGGGGGDGGDGTAGQRRRWSLSMHRRSNSFGAGGRPSSRAAAAAAAESPARPPSRRQAGHSRRGSRGAGEFGPPPSPLSPRMLMSVMLGSASGQDQQEAEQGCESSAVSPKPHLDELPSPGGLADLLLQLPAGLSRSKAGNGAAEPEPVEQPQLPQQQCGRPQAASGSVWSVGVVDLAHVDWEDEVLLPMPPASGAAHDTGLQEQQQQQQFTQQQASSSEAQVGVDSSSSAATAALAAEDGSCLVESAPNQCRWSGRVLPGPAAVAVAGSCAGSSGEDGRTCGVCLDALPNACILPCRHTMCVDCASDMCDRFSMAAAVCPFCRCIIRGFTATDPASYAATAGHY